MWQETWALYLLRLRGRDRLRSIACLSVMGSGWSTMLYSVLCDEVCC